MVSIALSDMLFVEVIDEAVFIKTGIGTLIIFPIGHNYAFVGNQIG